MLLRNFCYSDHPLYPTEKRQHLRGCQTMQVTENCGSFFSDPYICKKLKYRCTRFFYKYILWTIHCGGVCFNSTFGWHTSFESNCFCQTSLSLQCAGGVNYLLYTGSGILVGPLDTICRGGQWRGSIYSYNPLYLFFGLIEINNCTVFLPIFCTPHLNFTFSFFSKCASPSRQCQLNTQPLNTDCMSGTYQIH